MKTIIKKTNAILIGLILFALFMSGCDKCSPVALKTMDLKPTATFTGSSGTSGSEGWCFSQGNPPPSSFSAGPGQVMVGFDNFFKPGADPFPCNDLRDTVFRGNVAFDVSQFDSVASADLLFDTQNSIERSNGETTASSPPKSFATVFGTATSTSTGKLPFDNEASLPGGQSIDVGVSSQVRSWVDKSHPNHGFVIAGPTDLVDSSNPPENNQAKVSWYGNFKLRIVYNPAQNPHAPQ